MRQNLGFLITSTGWGGLEMNTIKLYRLLIERGYAITLFCVEGSRFEQACKEGGLDYVLVERQRKYFDFRRARALAEFCREYELSVLMVFDTRDLNLVFVLKRFFLKSLHIVYQQHMQIGVNKRDLLHTLTYRALTYWITPLKWLKSQVLEKTRVAEERVKVIPLGLEIEKFKNFRMSQSKARSLFDIKSKKILIGIVGRIAPYKGQKFLVEAIAALRNQGSDIELLIVGEPTVNEAESLQYLDEIKKLIEENKLSKHVYLRSYIEDVRPFYKAIDVFVLASKAETYGMVTLEAMLSEKIVIATNSAGTPEILNYGERGYLYEPREKADLVRQLVYVLANKAEARRKARKAHQAVTERFSARYECDQVENLLRSL